MKKLVLIIFYIVLFLESLVFFIPKDRAVFYLEDTLKQKLINISQESIEDKGFLLKAKEVNINYDRLDVASIKDLKLYTFLFFNSLKLKDIKLKSISMMVPKKIYSANLHWSIFNPIYVKIEVDGEFGNAKGYIDLIHKKLSLLIKPSKLFLRGYRQTIRMLKKEKSGYRFNYIFE